jgi:hypothetical protein
MRSGARFIMDRIPLIGKWVIFGLSPRGRLRKTCLSLYL